MTRTGFALVLLAAGCASPGGGALAWQRDYANNIPDPAARAAALRSVALSAAYTGEAKTVRAALGDLDGDPSHDDVARQAAVELNKAGHPAEARRVAKRIGNRDLRRATLDGLEPKPEEPPADPPADPPKHLPPERIHGGII